MTHVNNAKIKLRRMHLKEDAASELRAAEADAAARPSAATREALSRVLDKAGLSTDPDATRDVFTFVEDQMRPDVGSRKKFQYELSAFRLTEAQVRQRFAAYLGSDGA